MKKGEMSSLDMTAVVTELKEVLVGAKLQKIYQSEKNEFYFYFYKTNDYILHVVSGMLMHLTNFKKEFPQVPPHFCMFLRKYLKNAIISKVIQPKSQRIIEIHFKRAEENYILIFELFSKGNIVLCDSQYSIIQPLFFQKWSTRTIKSKEMYIHPPTQNPDLKALDEQTFIKLVLKSDKIDTVRFLAVDLGLGGDYAEEVLFRAKVDKNEPPKTLSKKSASVIYSELTKIIAKLMTGDTEPNMIFNLGSPAGAFPIIMESKKFEKIKEFNSFNHAIDDFFAGEEKYRVLQEKKVEFNKKLNEFVKRYEDQEKACNEFVENSIKLKQKAEFYSKNQYLVQSILDRVLSSRKSGYSWEDILMRIKQEKQAGVEEAQIIKRVEPHLGKVYLDLENGEYEFDIHDNISEIVNSSYEGSKNAEEKLEGAKKAMSETREEIEKIKKKEASFEFEPSLKRIEKKKSNKWYEIYRWFVSTEGYLVVSGRDETQNEVLVRKYMELNDKVFHADIHGSPFTLIKSKTKDIPEATMKQAAIQTGSYSRAWKEGLGNVDVYCAEPTQVSKKSPAGEYLPKGGFMFYGKKTYFKNTVLELGIGVKIIEGAYQIIAGPYEAIKKSTTYFVKIVPGQTGPKQLSREIISNFKLKAFSTDSGVMEQINPSDIEYILPGNAKILM